MMGSRSPVAVTFTIDFAIKFGYGVFSIDDAEINQRTLVGLRHDLDLVRPEGTVGDQFVNSHDVAPSRNGLSLFWSLDDRSRRWQDFKAQWLTKLGN
jgi:hypothetical protein